MRKGMTRAAFAAFVTLAELPATISHAEVGDCGQPQSTGSGPKTADALAALRAAVGSNSACDEKPCICDVTGNGVTQTSDAQLILRGAVGQSVTLACNCPCTELGGGAALASTRGTFQPQQVEIAATIVAINKESFTDLGLSFDLVTDVLTDLGPAPGGTSGHAGMIAVDSSASGGPEDVQYLVYPDTAADAALPILNKNFVSPFDEVKTVVGLPTNGCVLFDAGTFSLPQNHPGGDPVDNVDPFDAGFSDAEIYYKIYGDMGAAALIASIQSDNRNKVLYAPVVHLYDRQSVLHMVDDVEPDVDDLIAPLKMRVQDVTAQPFGVFTGPVLDVRPTIDGSTVHVQLRIGSEMATFFYSTAFLVDGVQTDSEIPIHRRSRNFINVAVPDNQTIAIGGILRAGAGTADKGLPVLGNIPLVGTLFDHKQVDADTQNLIILIRASIKDDF
jgi:type II secretory pathway component GspD/PulD (secretin)